MMRSALPGQGQTGHQIVEVDGESADYSSYLSSSDDEGDSLVKKHRDRRESSDEEIDIEKLD